MPVQVGMPSTQLVEWTAGCFGCVRWLIVPAVAAAYYAHVGDMWHAMQTVHGTMARRAELPDGALQGASPFLDLHAWNHPLSYTYRNCDYGT